jgi:hypothetical protein
MPKSFSAHIGVPYTKLAEFGAFDPILDVDTRLFIDPHLLKYCKIDEFANSYQHLKEHFQKICKLLKASDVVDDRCWKAADKLMNWREVKGLCIGYSSKSVEGSGIGPELRRRLLVTAKEIIKKGNEDSELFELLGLFEDGFGADRISDMTANIIKDEILAYTKRIIAALRTGCTNQIAIDSSSGLSINPYSKKPSPILLVPEVILRDLPVALEWSDRDRVAQENEELRHQVNLLIGESWKDAQKGMSKESLKDVIFDYPELMDDLISQYKRKGFLKYDFASDRSGEYVWLKASQKAAQENPLALALSANPDVESVFQMVSTIAKKFKELCENNGLCSLFYNAKGKPKPESAIQLLFYGIAEAYCDANGIMIARECNSGRGPVDFKFGTHKQNSILVEVKKSTNTSGLKKGVERQLPEYMLAEGSKRAIYLIVNVGFTETSSKTIKAINTTIRNTGISLIIIDGIPKKSASK